MLLQLLLQQRPLEACRWALPQLAAAVLAVTIFVVFTSVSYIEVAAAAASSTVSELDLCQSLLTYTTLLLLHHAAAVTEWLQH